MFVACVTAFDKCLSCDEEEAGYFERLDCGCYREIEVGRYETKAAARLAAIAKAKRKGTTLDGRMSGDWSVETEEGTIEAGSVRGGE